MKKILYILLVAITTLIVQSCKQNDGEIGDLYGNWGIAAMKVDGERYDKWRDAEHAYTTFSFQNNICMIQSVSDKNVPDTRTCTWKWEAKNNIALNFTHYDDRYEPGQYMYSAPEWLLLETNTIHNFEVTWHGEDRMVWKTVNVNGQHLEYDLRRTW